MQAYQATRTVDRDSKKLKAPKMTQSNASKAAMHQLAIVHELFLAAPPPHSILFRVQCSKKKKRKKRQRSGRWETEGRTAKLTGQPHGIILMTRGLQRPQAQVGRQRPTQCVGQEAGEDVEEDEREEASDDGKNGVRLGDLQALLQRVQRWILGQLRARGVRGSWHGEMMVSCDGWPVFIFVFFFPRERMVTKVKVDTTQ